VVVWLNYGILLAVVTLSILILMLWTRVLTNFIINYCYWLLDYEKKNLFPQDFKIEWQASCLCLQIYLCTDRYIDLHWVWTLTVPMHLDLTDGPFVPHNLISAQESPVPLPKFQMTPRLKILMSSGTKKGTQIYYPSLSKSPWKQIPSRFPNRAPMERGTRLQGIFHLSWYIFLTYLLGSPVKEPSLQVPLMESPQREMPRSQSPLSFII